MPCTSNPWHIVDARHVWYHKHECQSLQIASLSECLYRPFGEDTSLDMGDVNMHTHQAHVHEVALLVTRWRIPNAVSTCLVIDVFLGAVASWPARLLTLRLGSEKRQIYLTAFVAGEFITYPL